MWLESELVRCAVRIECRTLLVVGIGVILSACSPHKKVVQREQQAIEQQVTEQVEGDSLKQIESGSEHELVQVEWWGDSKAGLHFDSLMAPPLKPVGYGGFRVVKVKQSQVEVEQSTKEHQAMNTMEMTQMKKGQKMKRGDPGRRIYWMLGLIALLLVTGLFRRKIWALRVKP